MTQFAVSGILLDIEGTTSSISFVYDVMFPFVRRELDNYLAAYFDQEECQAACRQIAEDAGAEGDQTWSATQVSTEVTRLMDNDVKATGLKQLQGLIWKQGFESGEMMAHVYEDVPPSLLRWNADGHDVRIYSSGSIQAQKLFFGHTEYGDLLGHLKGHYDTTTGPKREADSYRQIVGEFNLPAEEILFLSDVVAELDAAKQAGLKTCLSIRPGNAEVPADHGHPAVVNFAHLQLV